MRDELFEHVSDEELIEALTKTSVVLIADGKNLKTDSAQSAYVTAAMLLARSGHRVYLHAPNVELVGPQPPLAPGNLIDQLVSIASDIMPGFLFALDRRHAFDLAIFFGNTLWSGERLTKFD